MQVTCPRCHASNDVICKNCGEILPISALPVIRPLDVAYYRAKDYRDVIIDHFLVDKLLRFLRPASSKILFFMLRHTKGGANEARQRTFTYHEIMAGTGIKSRGTLAECLAELDEGRPASEKCPEITGWQLIKRVNKKRKSKHVNGNRYILNTELMFAGQMYPLFYAGGQGYYFEMHPGLIDVLMPMLTPQEWAVFVFIFRLAIGFNKQADTIALAYFTGKRSNGVYGEEEEEVEEVARQSAFADNRTIWKAVNGLEKYGLIFVKRGETDRDYPTFTLNKDLLLDIESRGNYQMSRGIYQMVARQLPDVARNLPDVARNLLPPNHVLNSLLNHEETNVLNAPAQTDSLRLHELSATLPQTTDGKDKLPVSEKPFAPKYSNEVREAMMRHAFGIRDENIQKAVATATDDQIDEALAHKKKFPKAGGGIFFNFFCNKGELYKWKAEENPNPKVVSKADAAPKSPPNGSGAAVPPPLSPDALIWQEVKQQLKLTIPVILNTQFVDRHLNNDGIDTFYVTATMITLDLLKHRLYSTVRRTLANCAENSNVHVEFQEVKQ